MNSPLTTSALLLCKCGTNMQYWISSTCHVIKVHRYLSQAVTTPWVKSLFCPEEPPNMAKGPNDCFSRRQLGWNWKGCWWERWWTHAESRARSQHPGFTVRISFPDPRGNDSSWQAGCTTVSPKGSVKRFCERFLKEGEHRLGTEMEMFRLMKMIRNRCQGLDEVVWFCSGNNQFLQEAEKG